MARSVPERSTSTSAKEGGPEFTVRPPKAVGVVEALEPLTTPTPLTAQYAERPLAEIVKPARSPPPVKLAMEVQVGEEVLPGREGVEAEYRAHELPVTLATPTTRAPPDTAQDTGTALAGQGPGGRVLSPNPPATLTLTSGDPAVSHHMVEPSKVHREVAREADTLARPSTSTLTSAPTPPITPNTFAGGVEDGEGVEVAVLEEVGETLGVVV